jgi:Mg2+ and Co2+ transporter CorA
MTNIVTVCAGAATLIVNAFGMNLVNDWKEEESGKAFATIVGVVIITALGAGSVLMRKYVTAEVLVEAEEE